MGIARVEQHDKLRIGYAFELISKANTVTILSLDEMERIVQRALEGEFDRDILIGHERRPLSEIAR